MIMNQFQYKFSQAENTYFNGPALSSPDFDKFESETGRLLSNQLKEFYLFMNGAYVKCSAFNTCLKSEQFPIGHKGSISVGPFYSLANFDDEYPGLPSYSYDDVEHLDNIPFQEWLEQDKEEYPLCEGWSPVKKESYISVADATGGTAYILIGAVRNNLGKVFYFDKEGSELYNPQLIASSLFELFNGLYLD